MLVRPGSHYELVHETRMVHLAERFRIYYLYNAHTPGRIRHNSFSLPPWTHACLPSRCFYTTAANHHRVLHHLRISSPACGTENLQHPYRWAWVVTLNCNLLGCNTNAGEEYFCLCASSQGLLTIVHHVPDDSGNQSLRLFSDFLITHLGFH